MDSFPKVGMKYEQARSRARRFASRGDAKTVNSLINQASLHEGPKAASELAREINIDYAKRNGVKTKYF